MKRSMFRCAEDESVRSHDDGDEERSCVDLSLIYSGFSYFYFISVTSFILVRNRNQVMLESSFARGIKGKRCGFAQQILIGYRRINRRILMGSELRCSGSAGTSQHEKLVAAL
ncbi:unnamed protein product [Lathyrus oleraceus]